MIDRVIESDQFSMWQTTLNHSNFFFQIHKNFHSGQWSFLRNFQTTNHRVLQQNLEEIEL